MVAVLAERCPDAALIRMLEDAHRFSAEFDRPEPAGPPTRFLANHLELCLVALQRLGGSESRLREFFDFYRRKKGLMPVAMSPAAVAGAEWRAHLGDRAYEAAYREFFAAETDRLGFEGVQRVYLPQLLVGLPASAFHAMIRLAFANLIADRNEVVAALAYWAVSFLDLGPLPAAPGFTAEPAVALERIRSDPALRIEHKGSSLWRRMLVMSRESAFAPVPGWLDVGPDTLARFARAGLALFAVSNEFTALHMVTATHALRVLLPLIADPTFALRKLWQAVAAVYGRAGFAPVPAADRLEPLRRIPTPDWPAIFAAAVDAEDEHDAKFVFSAVEEHKIYGDPLYRYAAALRVGLVDGPAASGEVLRY